MPTVVDPVAESRLDRSMVNRKSRDFQIAILVDEALLDIFGHDNHALRGKFLVHVAANMDIELVRLFQMRHHLGCTRRPPYTKRSAPAENPASQIKIGNANGVVGMQVRQK